MIDPQARQDAMDLRRAVSRLQRAFRQTRDPHGPTSAQLSALGTLYREGPLATGTLAAREGLQPQSITRLVAALEQARLIERAPDEADARRVVVAITDEGRRQLEGEIRRRVEFLAGRIAGLSPHDRATVRAATTLLEWLAGAPTAGAGSRGRRRPE